jgi:hypothetical protein
VRVEPADLEGRRGFVEVRAAEYTNEFGETIKRNQVPYDGYRALAPGDGEDAGNGGAPVPF